MQFPLVLAEEILNVCEDFKVSYICALSVFNQPYISLEKEEGKSLVCTDLVRMMVETFPMKELIDLECTGHLQKTLSDIEKKKHTKADFMDIITEFVKKFVDNIKNSAGMFSYLVKKFLNRW